MKEGTDDSESVTLSTMIWMSRSRPRQVIVMVVPPTKMHPIKVSFGCVMQIDCVGFATVKLGPGSFHL